MTPWFSIGISLLAITISVVNVWVNRRFTDYLAHRQRRFDALRSEGKSPREAAAIVEATISFWDKHAAT